MGYIYQELVPPAILFDNPGITRKEYAALLEKAYLTRDPYPRGMIRLATSLGLKETEEFKRSQQSKRREDGISVVPITQMLNELEVIGTTNPVIGNERIIEIERFDSLRVGSSTVPDVDKQDIQAIVKEIISKRSIGVMPDEDQETFHYVIRALFYWQQEIQHRYTSLDQLYAAWPHLAPENRFDFSQESGAFILKNNPDNFLWYMQGGKYYFDPASFDLMPVSKTYRWRNPRHSFGYHDLILTAEAIRLQAGRFLFRDSEDKNCLFDQYPESYKRYLKAARDTEVSEFAIAKGLTNAEFLRLRLSAEVDMHL